VSCYSFLAGKFGPIFFFSSFSFFSFRSFRFFLFLSLKVKFSAPDTTPVIVGVAQWTNRGPDHVDPYKMTLKTSELALKDAISKGGNVRTSFLSKEPNHACDCLGSKCIWSYSGSMLDVLWVWCSWRSCVRWWILWSSSSSTLGLMLGATDACRSDSAMIWGFSRGAWSTPRSEATLPRYAQDLLPSGFLRFFNILLFAFCLL